MSLGELALKHFIDPATGMLHESFDDSWKPTKDLPPRQARVNQGISSSGRGCSCAGGSTGSTRGAGGAALDRSIAESHGVQNGVAINAIVNDTSNSRPARPGSGRRLSGYALQRWLRGFYGESRYWTMAGEAAASLLRYFETPVPGLWYDRLSDGKFVPETVTAGNLYHIVGAIYEMAALIRSTP